MSKVKNLLLHTEYAIFAQIFTLTVVGIIGIRYGLPTNLMVAIIWLYISIILLIGFACGIYYGVKNAKLVHNLENNFETEPMEQFYRKIMSKYPLQNSFRFAASMNLAYALMAKGRYEEATKEMLVNKDFAESKANRLERVMYHNNYLSYLLDMDKLDEAKDYYQAHLELLKDHANQKNKILCLATSSTLSTYEVLLGNASKGKRGLENLLPEIDNNRLSKITAQYYIARADLKLGNKEEAMAQLTKLETETKGIGLHQKIVADLKR